MVSANLVHSNLNRYDIADKKRVYRTCSTLGATDRILTNYHRNTPHARDYSVRTCVLMPVI